MYARPHPGNGFAPSRRMVDAAVRLTPKLVREQTGASLDEYADDDIREALHEVAVDMAVLSRETIYDMQDMKGKIHPRCVRIACKYAVMLLQAQKTNKWLDVINARAQIGKLLKGVNK